jgi:undecaprenyl-diphosphatase
LESAAVPDWINAVILGVVEGLTEFIPVSSTGHLLLVSKLMGLKDPFWDTFNVLIQLGAVLAVVVLYFGRFWNVLIRLPSDPKARRFAAAVVIGSIPAAIAGFLLHDAIKQILFESPRVICTALLIGGILLLIIDRVRPAPRRDDAFNLPVWTALAIGCFQCLALVPGVSRSGSTIVGGMLLGVEKKAAAEFSFFLAIPIMMGSFILDGWKSRHELTSHNVYLVAIGFVVAFVVAMVVIRAMLAIVTRRGFGVFGWWRIVVGAVGLAVLQFAA